MAERPCVTAPSCRSSSSRWSALLLAVTVAGCSAATKDDPHTTTTYAIRGAVGGAVSAGVTVTLSGAASASTTTAADGTYAFTGLSSGTYAIQASRSGYTFSPITRSVTVNGGDQVGQNFTATAVASTYTIGGTVTGALTVGVTITVSGAATRTTTTGAGGTYALTGLAGGSYTITPSAAGYTFTPASRSVTLAGANQTGQDFVATAVAGTYTISGTVSGAVTSGVTVTLSGASAATTTTTAGGTYAFAGLANGSYTVTPSLAGYTFTPSSRPVTIASANQPAQDFAAAAVTYSLGGAVSGAATSGVTITLSGAASASTTTGPGGTYTFTGLAPGSYTVTPSLAGHSFTPPSRSVTITGANLTAQDFTSALLTYTITGTVSGAVTSGVTVALSGAANRTTTTGVGGGYAFTGLVNGSYVVSPSLTGYDFTPPSRAVTVAGANQPAQDFTAAVSAAPPPPAAVSVVPADGAAVVSWTPSAGATSYKVYYGTTSGLTTGSTSVSTTSLSAAVSGLPNGQRRFFAVSAVGAGGESALTVPRCGVPTAASQSFRGTPLDLHDGLCEDRLDQSRWYIPGAWSAGVSGGKAALTVDADHMEPWALRGDYVHATTNVNGGGARITTLSAVVQVPLASTSQTGGGQVRAAVRIAYAPPGLRLAYPSPNRDFLLIEAGLTETGGGLHAYRNVYHCDDGKCGILGTTGIAIADPAGFTAAANLATAPATYDTPYRVTVSLDESTGVFHWSIQGGSEFATAASGTADPAAYLAATSSWTGIPLAGSGFNTAQIAVRALDSSLTGGGSVRMTALFDDVQVGFNGAGAGLWDDFSGTGGNSGPTELSLARWNGLGAPRVMPTGDGALLMHAEATSAGTALVVSEALSLPAPEAVDVLQADVFIPSFTGSVQGVARVDGRFHNDGTGTVTGSAYGDVFAAVYVTDNGTSRWATWFLFKCQNANCSGSVTVGGSGTIAAPSLSGVQALRVAYDRGTDEFVFGVGTTFVTVPAPAGYGYVAPARAPLKRVQTFVSVPAQAGAKATIDVRVNNVFTASLTGGGGGGCNALDPLAASSVEMVGVAAAPPAATGGTISDGTYAMTATTTYTGPGGFAGPSGFTWRHVWTFTGSHVEVALLFDDGTIERHAGTYGVSGTTLTFIEACPGAGSVKQFAFSVSGASIALQDATGPGTSGPGTASVYTLARQ